MNTLGGPVLSDRVVQLSPISVADAEEHFGGPDHTWQRWLGPGQGCSSMAATVSWLCRCEERWRRGGPVFVFGVRAVSRPGLLGTVELQLDERASAPRRASLSCGLYPRARGRGTGVRACRLASDFALHELADRPWGVTEVVAEIDPRNVASVQMVERAGFVYADSCTAVGEAWDVFTIDPARLEHVSAARL